MTWLAAVSNLVAAFLVAVALFRAIGTFFNAALASFCNLATAAFALSKAELLIFPIPLAVALFSITFMA